MVSLLRFDGHRTPVNGHELTNPEFHEVPVGEYYGESFLLIRVL